MAQDKPPQADHPQAGKPLDQATLEKDFAERLSGAQLVGRFTVHGQDDKPPAKERYVLERVAKQQGDYWLFVARIQYGNNDFKIPLTIPVKWAGDTPVITVDKLAIPGSGTFSARVVIHGDQYAGTWDAGDHGGHLFGKIEKLPPQEALPDKPDKIQRADPKPARNGNAR
jgi:hypothetical protein